MLNRICDACEVAWQAGSSLCWNCGGPGRIGYTNLRNADYGMPPYGATEVEKQNAAKMFAAYCRKIPMKGPLS